MILGYGFVLAKTMNTFDDDGNESPFDRR